MLGRVQGGHAILLGFRASNKVRKIPPPPPHIRITWPQPSFEPRTPKRSNLSTTKSTQYKMFPFEPTISRIQKNGTPIYKISARAHHIPATIYQLSYEIKPPQTIPITTMPKIACQQQCEGLASPKIKYGFVKGGDPIHKVSIFQACKRHPVQQDDPRGWLQS